MTIKDHINGMQADFTFNPEPEKKEEGLLDRFNPFSKKPKEEPQRTDFFRVKITKEKGYG
jgi:hypothetical protein